MDKMNNVIAKLRINRDNKLKFLFWKVVWRHYQNKYFVTIPSRTIIGEDFKILHYGNIQINPNTIIGDRVIVAQGVTLGLSFGGKKKGTPTIGNDVYIGPNSVVVGNVKIGDNVFIAPNTFVNFDVPDDSFVIGSPGEIHPRHRENKE